MNSKRSINENSLVKVRFYVGDEKWHHVESESVWAEMVENNIYRIRNTPFYVKGISFEDLVTVKEMGGILFFNSVFKHSGHSTYRVMMPIPSEENKGLKEKFIEYWKPLESVGCSYESTKIGRIDFYAIDVPPEANIYHVYDLLMLGENDHIWDFEEGHCGHLNNQDISLN